MVLEAEGYISEAVAQLHYWMYRLRAISEAVAQLHYWMYRLCVMLPVTAEVVFVTSAKSSIELATNRGQRD